MSKRIYLIICLIATAISQAIYAQQISYEEVFKAQKYSVFEYGYPLMVAPAGADDFLFIEYWPGEIAGRKEDNYYLQRYNIREYGELWFKPLTYIGYDQIPDVLDLHKLDKKYVVIGHQYADAKKVKTVARFFDQDGKSLELDVTPISKYDKGNAAKEPDEKLYYSPNDKCFMWFSVVGGKYYASAWSSNAENVWNKTLEIPYGDKYTIIDAVIDDKANPTFLLKQSKPSFSKKDTAFPPIIMRMNAASGKFSAEKIDLDSTYMLHGNLQLMNNEELIIAGVLSNSDPKDKTKVGILNGAKANLPGQQRWTNFYCSHYKFGGDSLKFVRDSIADIPDNWNDKYASVGSNFVTSRLEIEPGTKSGVEPTAILIFEEAYRQDDKIFFCDIGAIGFRINTCENAFASIISKKQRDQGSGQYYSYALGHTKAKCHFVYLSEGGAAGKLLCQTLDLKTGKITEKMLAKNDQALYYFFPSRSRMVNANQMILVGTGNPSQNNYKLITIMF